MITKKLLPIIFILLTAMGCGKTQETSSMEEQPDSQVEIEANDTDKVSANIVDTIPPVVTAEDIIVTEGDPISYKKNVTVTDNSDDDVTLEIDDSQVDKSVPGTYPVYYTATDSSGNSTKIQVQLTIEELLTPEEEEVLAMADEVLELIVTPNMSQYDIAYELWMWCRNHISYSYSAGDRSSIYTGAYEGLHNQCGDCYTYYATYSVLLTRAGIENMCVARVGGESNHWWNLVNTGNGWYHCDSSPRNNEHPYHCFMQTDAQVQAYTDSYPEHPNYYTFDPELYPERATDIIYGN